MSKIGFSDDNLEIRRAVAILRENSYHVPVVYGNLTNALNSLKAGEIDCLVGGHDITTKEFLKEVFGSIKPIGRVYSYSVLSKNGKTLYFADSGVNPTHTEEQLVELEGALIKELKPFLDCFEMTRVGYKTEGNVMQLDAALDAAIAKKKGITDFKEKNVLVFPDLNSANLAYKITQRLGGYSHAGPILLNTGYPISDLSRGADAQEIFNTAKYLGDLTANKKLADKIMG